MGKTKSQPGPTVSWRFESGDMKIRIWATTEIEGFNQALDLMKEGTMLGELVCVYPIKPIKEECHYWLTSVLLKKAGHIVEEGI